MSFGSFPIMEVDRYPSSPDEAIPLLFDAYADRVYRLGMRLCDRSDFAEDLVQETFLRAYRSWGAFKGRSQPMTWLYAIASRACQRLERRRAGEPRKLDPLDRLLEFGHGAKAGEPSTDVSPLDQAIRSQEAAHLRHAIATLPARFRLPLVLKEFEGLSIREIADVLGLREATVKTRLHRARLALRDSVQVASPTWEDDTAHTRRQCADLVTAKLEAMARGATFPISNDRICARCRPTLEALDRTRTLCSLISSDPLPDEVRRRVKDSLDKVARHP